MQKLPPWNRRPSLQFRFHPRFNRTLYALFHGGLREDEPHRGFSIFEPRTGESNFIQDFSHIATPSPPATRPAGSFVELLH